MKLRNLSLLSCLFLSSCGSTTGTDSSGDGSSDTELSDSSVVVSGDDASLVTLEDASVVQMDSSNGPDTSVPAKDSGSPADASVDSASDSATHQDAGCPGHDHVCDRHHRRCNEECIETCYPATCGMKETDCVGHHGCLDRCTDDCELGRQKCDKHVKK